MIESSLTKAALVEEVPHVADLTKKHAGTIVDAVFGSIVEALHRGEKVELRGFGSFRLRRREPRKGRNLRTGDRVDVPRTAIAVALLLTLSCGGQTVAPDVSSVILIVVDTLRADHLGLYGYERPTSPTLDAWAAGGRVFEHAFAPAPWTLPSFSSIYTGRWPLIHQGGRPGVPTPDGNGTDLAPVAHVPMVAEHLHAAGVVTMATVTNPYLAPAYGLARGFDVYDVDTEAENGQYQPAAEMVRRALALLDRADGQPFFLVVHLMDPHQHYDAPPPFRGTWTDDIASDFTLPMAHLNGRQPEDLLPADRAFVIAAYDEEIAYLDAQLGVLRNGLADRGVLETSLVIFTADHGEELFDHGGYQHGHALWQELVHVPMVVWGPGIDPGREPAPVSLVDIAPTVLDGMGVAATMPFDGVSLWPTLVAGESLPSRPLFAEGIQHGPLQSAVVRWPQKLIVNHADAYRDVYDLAEDPHERHSLASEARALVADLCRHQQTGDDSDRAPVTPNEDILERLRSLGYLGGSAATTSFLEDRLYPCYSDVGWGALVHVRWADSVDAALRTTLEQSLGLVRAEHVGETTWRYRLPDPSPDRLRTIANHAMVEDTHGFDRATLELDSR